MVNDKLWSTQGSTVTKTLLYFSKLGPYVFLFLIKLGTYVHIDIPHVWHLYVNLFLDILDKTCVQISWLTFFLVEFMIYFVFNPICFEPLLHFWFRYEWWKNFPSLFVVLMASSCVYKCIDIYVDSFFFWNWYVDIVAYIDNYNKYLYLNISWFS